MRKRSAAAVVLSMSLALTACTNTDTTPPAVHTQTGSVAFSNIGSTTVTLTDSSGKVIPASGYSKLAPGTYTVTYSRDGYVTQTRTINVTAGGNTTYEVPTLVAKTVVVPTGSYYRDDSGNLVSITSTDASRFHFVAYMQDAAGGVNPAMIGSGDAGAALAAEQSEVAPVNHQNLIAGYVSYQAADGKWYPVIGAQVRMDILEQTGSVRFSASDDGSLDSGAMQPQDINANGTSTVAWTNSATGNNIPFPASASYPLYNMTGVATPNVNGFTWATLNHDPRYPSATARVRAIAYVNGVEVDKQFLNKTFAPSAKLEILKTVDNADAVTGQARNFTITVRNTGQGAATGISLQDRLTTGSADTYAIGTLPVGGTAVDATGFDASFDLAPGAERTFTFPATASATGSYCDTATIASYTNGTFGLVTPTDMKASACMTVRAPRLTIVKDIVDAAGNVLGNPTVPAGQAVSIRVRVTNGGDLTATGVAITDTAAAANAAGYSIGAVSPVTGVTAAGTGFTVAAQDIAPGQTATYTFPAQATADGRYCDTASFTSTNAGTGSADACFTVATARLNITKANTPTAGLYPGASYTSTITVSNTGTASALNVQVADIIGKNTGGSYVLYGSGSYTVTGTAQTGSVSFDSASQTATAQPTNVSIPAGGSLVMTVTSTIPAGARAGEYCDVASFASSNSQPASGQAQACVTVSSYIAEQTQLTDTVEPLQAGANTTIVAAAAMVELSSNQGKNNNVMHFNFGTTDPANWQGGGVFNYRDMHFYYDPTPVRDAQTGAVTSDYTNATTQEITSQVTLTAPTGTGAVTATFAPSFTVQPGGAIWVRTTVAAPAGTPAGQYQQVFRWTGTGVDTPGTTLVSQKAESTTVIP